MSENLHDLALFAEMSGDELALIDELTEAEDREVGDLIYGAGDSVSAFYVVLEGAVELVAPLAEGQVERVVSTARPGEMFGWLTMIDGRESAGTARVSEAARLLQFPAGSFATLRARAPEAHQRLLESFLRVMSQQVRDLLESFRASVEWNLEISGLLELGVRDLVGGGAWVELRLQDGEVLTGRILRYDSSPAGGELLLRSADERLHFIPYRAVGRISVTVDQATETKGG